MPRNLKTFFRESHVPAFVFFLTLAILVILPVFFHMRTAVFGLGGDSLRQVWVIWWRKYSLLHGLDYRTLSLAQAPFTTDHVKWFFRPLYTLILALLAIPTQPLMAYNLSILLGLTLSGYLAYRLSFVVTRSRLVSVYAGAAYAIAPSALFFADDHGGASQRWVFPLLLLAVVNLRRKQTIWAACLLGVAAVFTADMHGYFGYFGVVLALVFVVVESVFAYRDGGWRHVFDRRRIALYGLAVLVSAILYSPVIIGGVRAYTEGPSNPLRLPQTFDRFKDSFFWTSARPWGYVLPSPDHFLLGDASARVYDAFEAVERLDMAPPVLKAIVPRLSPHWFWTTTELTRKRLYLGLVSLGLAVYLLYRRYRRRDLPDKFDESEPYPRRFWYVFFTALFVVAILYTAPPFLPLGSLLRPIWEPLNNIVIPMPSAITLVVAPQLRNPSYFIILVNLALAILSAMGLKLLIERLHREQLRWLVTGGLLIVMAFEVAVPSRMLAVPLPDEYVWLMEEQPQDTIIAAYPLTGRLEGYFQTIHERPAVGQPHAEPVDDAVFQITQPLVEPITVPGAPGILAALGTRYVFYAYPPLNETPEGLSVLMTFDERAVYEVTASPTPLLVLETYRGGMWTSQPQFGWQADTYVMNVWNPLLDDLVVDIGLLSPDVARMDTLYLSQTLTPLPDQTFIAGVRQDNPMLRPDYTEQTLSGIASGGKWRFDGLHFRTGQTILTFEWADGTDPPIIDDIVFTVVGAEPFEAGP